MCNYLFSYSYVFLPIQITLDGPLHVCQTPSLVGLWRLKEATSSPKSKPSWWRRLLTALGSGLALRKRPSAQPRERRRRCPEVEAKESQLAPEESRLPSGRVWIIFPVFFSWKELLWVLCFFWFRQVFEGSMHLPWVWYRCWAWWQRKVVKMEWEWANFGGSSTWFKNVCFSFVEYWYCTYHSIYVHVSRKTSNYAVVNLPGDV